MAHEEAAGVLKTAFSRPSRSASSEDDQALLEESSQNRMMESLVLGRFEWQEKSIDVGDIYTRRQT
jgi:hypothetical protein